MAGFTQTICTYWPALAVHDEHRDTAPTRGSLLKLGQRCRAAALLHESRCGHEKLTRRIVLAVLLTENRRGEIVNLKRTHCAQRR